MSLFKKLFGPKNASPTRPDFNALFSMPEKEDAVMAIDDYLCKRSAYGENMSMLTGPQRNFFLNQDLEREINNGGFNQFFFNSSGDYAHETVLSLQAIGAHATAVIVQKAIDQFPGSDVPADRPQRQKLLLEIEEKADTIWNQLDNAFYEYEDDLAGLNLEYVKQHLDEF